MDEKDLISVVGIGGSLFWNWLNGHRAKKQKEQTGQLEEFKSHVRQPIEIALSRVDDTTADIEILLLSGQDFAQKKSEAIAVVTTSLRAATKLSQALTAAGYARTNRNTDLVWAELDSPFRDHHAKATNSVHSATDVDAINKGLREIKALQEEVCENIRIALYSAQPR